MATKTGNERAFYPGVQRYTGAKSLTKAIAEGRITDDDRNLIEEYVAERQATKHISDARVNKIVFTLVGWRRLLPVPYRKAKMPDIYKAIGNLKSGDSTRGKPFKQNTIHDYIRILKPFLRWMIDSEYTDLSERKVREISAPSVDYNTTEPDELLTVEEIESLLKACLNPRDRAFFSVLYESGCRIGEVARIRWRDIVFDKYGIKLYVRDQKTDKRRYVRLTISSEYIAQWKADYHPGTPAGDALVFQTFKGRPLDYIQANRIIKRAKERAGIEKNLHPHIFRHSRITHMISQGYQESVIKKAMWGNVGTEMFRTYVNLSEADIDNEFLDKAGIIRKEGKAKALKHIMCSECHSKNPPTGKYCTSCGTALTEEAQVEQHEAVTSAITDLGADQRLTDLQAQVADLTAKLEKLVS